MNSVFFARLTKDNPLSSHDQGFVANLVYSYLIKKTRFNKAVTAYQIAKYLDLPQSYTVKPAIDLLVSLGLVRRHEQKTLIANPPPDGWYVPKKSSTEHWADGFAYFPMCISFDFLSTKQNAIYWAIKARPNQRQTWYSLVMAISRSTATKAINKLRSMGLVSMTGYYANPVIPEQWKNTWTRTKKKKKEKKFVPIFAVPEPLPKKEKPAKTEKPVLQNENAIPAPAPAKTEKQVFQNEKKDWLALTKWRNIRKHGEESLEANFPAVCQQLSIANFSQGEIVEYMDTLYAKVLAVHPHIASLAEFCIRLPQIVAYAEKRTKINRSNGTFHGKNSMGMLQSETHRAIEQFKIAIENMLANNSSFLFWEYSPPEFQD